MRKLLSAVSGLLIVAMLVSALSMTALAMDGTDYVSADARVEKDAVTLVIKAASATTDGKLSVSYDAGLLNYESIAVSGTVSSVEEAEGKVTFGYACVDAEKIAQGGVIATVRFSLKESSGTSSFMIAVETFNSREDLEDVRLGVYVGLSEDEPVRPVLPGNSSDPGDEPEDKPVAEPGLSFVDVPQGAWFYDAVEYVVRSGYFMGTSDTTFSPDSAMTRAMFVTVLGRMAGVSVDHNTTGGFTDVKAGSYYAGYVAWAAQNGIVTGTSETTFAPDEMVTREQMAAFLYRYAKYLGMDVASDGSALNTFADASEVSAWAGEAVAWATARKIINGTGTGIEPKATATRAQVAQIVWNFSQYAE